ncbi:Zeatin O-xylosyltransferase [Capsicum annuum]|uniref:Zeatin O-xylosyltransferase n=1 Tax=Capsicum annuum TaxID=4072 RepID=A0A2G2YP17_CAPAN|nr:Zeatin O-xylosyltransferase [Capsicum annuum]
MKATLSWSNIIYIYTQTILIKYSIIIFKMTTKYEVVVVIVPFPAQGHLNQLLHFSSLISSYNNIQVHYVSTKNHTRQAKIRAHGLLKKNPNIIHFHEFSIPSFPSPPPNPNSNIKFPSHLQPSFESSYHLRGPVASLLRSLSSIARRVVVVHDSLMAYVVQDFTTIPNAESYNFHSVSAFTIFFFLWESMGKPFPIEAELLDNLPSLEGAWFSYLCNLSFSLSFSVKIFVGTFGVAGVQEVTCSSRGNNLCLRVKHLVAPEL